MQAQTDLTNISALKKIRCLKDLFITNAILPYSSLESRVTKKKKKYIRDLPMMSKGLNHVLHLLCKPLDVFHQLKIAASFIDLFDRVGPSDFIDQLAQNHAIFQYVLKPGNIDNLALFVLMIFHIICSRLIGG